MLKMPEAELITELRRLVGSRHVAVGASARRRFGQGYRVGDGPVLAGVSPGDLWQQWLVLQACITANVIVIMQAANTGLTGGSTPNGEYDRAVVVISTKRLTGIHVLDGGRQVLCLPGATLYQLEKVLRPFGREPHSVIGSSCIGASVMGGVCNNSGGALVRRGPAYTELALYARVDETGTLTLVNHLGIRLGDDTRALLAAVQKGSFATNDVEYPSHRVGSDTMYAAKVRQVDEPTPARFNADASRLFEASGSAGKIALFAIRLDTFETSVPGKTFYIGTNDPADLHWVRRSVLQADLPLPIAGEYMHGEAFDIAEQYGKDMFLAIRLLGTERLALLYAIKSRIDSIALRSGVLPRKSSDRLMQLTSKLFPRHLPLRMSSFRERFEHHLILKVDGDGVGGTRALLDTLVANSSADYFDCTAEESEKAFLHRFVMAGSAIRYRVMHEAEVEDIVALDIALRRNEREWFERLPAELENPILHRLYYGHFLCHVFHQDYLLSRGTDLAAFEERLHEVLDDRGAEYPAEHNVGHHYHAKEPLQSHYLKLDPTNRFNPGIGQTSRNAAFTSTPL